MFLFCFILFLFCFAFFFVLLIFFLEFVLVLFGFVLQFEDRLPKSYWVTSAIYWRKQLCDRLSKLHATFIFVLHFQKHLICHTVWFALSTEESNHVMLSVVKIARNFHFCSVFTKTFDMSLSVSCAIYWRGQLFTKVILFVLYYLLKKIIMLCSLLMKIAHKLNSGLQHQNKQANFSTF